jgi:ribosome-binding factor A
MKSRRVKRAEELIKRELSQIFNRELREHNFGFVTVTNVECSPDLKHAEFFVSIMESDEEQETKNFNRIKRSLSKIRGLLASRLRDMRYIPYLKVTLDKGLDKIELIEKLLDEDSSG